MFRSLFRLRRVTVAVASASVCAACGSSSDGISAGHRPTEDGGGCNTTDVPDSGTDGTAAAAACEPVVEAHAIEGAAHAPICSPLTYGTNPPSSGNHYAVWADYKTYTTSFPRGFWVHNLEHGAVVITYNCPDGCAAEVADAQAFIDSLPADCGPGARRIILMPDPELDVRFAASSWGFTLKAKCFDRAAFSSFYCEHYDRAPEAICTTGTDPTGGLSGSPVCP